MRLYDTELIAFGVGEHDMRFVRGLTNVDVPGTQLDQPRHGFVLVVERCGRQVEMDAVLAHLGLRNGPEHDAERGLVGWHQGDLVTGLVVVLPPQRVRPELRQTERIVRIEAESDKARRHTATSVVGLQSIDTRVTVPYRRDRGNRIFPRVKSGVEARKGAAGSVAEMTVIDDQGRPEPPLAADETATLLGFLDYQRATFEWKCRGLDAAGLQTTIGVSSMTLGGMLKHMALVEDNWFSRSLHGHDRRPPWDTVDWKADPDWEWHSAAEDAPEQLQALWHDAVARSRTQVAEAFARGGGLDQLAQRTWPDGSAPSLRWILCHMIEEYARHNGHADLIRESVDGSTGE